MGFNKESKYQNLAEYLGLTLGLIAARALGIRDLSVALRGDSMTAIMWCSKERLRSDLATRAVIFATLLMMEWRITLPDSELIKAEQNELPDRLSRDPGLTIADVTLHDDPLIGQVLALCRPGEGLDSEEGFRAFWLEAHRLITALSLRYPGSR